MTWTNTVPTYPGTYWWRAKKDAIKRIVFIEWNGGHLHARGEGAMDLMLEKAPNVGGQWAGPIEEPND